MAALTAGDEYTYALTMAGAVKCWGQNADGRLGDGTLTTPRLTPVEVCATGATPPCSAANGNLLTDVAAVAAGAGHTCALTTTGGLKCWGANGYGQLGDGTTTPSTTPVDVCATGATAPCSAANGNLLTGVRAVSAGGSHTCALTTAGGVKCWGRNVDGQLGDGHACGDPCFTPVDSLVTAVAAVAAGGSHTCALRLSQGGGVQC